MLLKRDIVISFLIIITLYSINCASVVKKKNINNTAQSGKQKSIIKQKVYGKTKMPTGESLSIENPFIRSTKCIPKYEATTVYDIKEDVSTVGCVLEYKTSEKCVEIIKILKLKNDCLLQRYESRSKDVMIELDAVHPNEGLLFYGVSTTEDAQNIALNGFDERLSTGGLFGDGIYFSAYMLKADTDARVRQSVPYPSYNVNLRHQNKTALPPFRMMFLSRVILGKIYLPNRAQGFAHAPIGHHSVAGNDDIVIYRGEQAYPEYLLFYRETDQLYCSSKITGSLSKCLAVDIVIYDFALEFVVNRLGGSN